VSRLLLPAAYGGASLAVHLVFVAMGHHAVPSPRAEVAPTIVQLALTPPPPEPPPAEPEPPSAQPEPPPVQPTPRPAARARSPAPPAPTPASAPAELTGTTLASDDTSSWSAPAGSGADRSGPIETNTVGAQPGSGQRASPPAPRPRAAAPAPATLPLTELSRKPSPPSLTEALERHYPRDARRLGRSGAASVRARIAENGVVSEARLKDETEPGFGAACQRALLGSRWSPPLDRRGLPVATWVSYRCKFRSQ
jgi:outer membrane biosynthesis protein TonB